MIKLIYHTIFNISSYNKDAYYPIAPDNDSPSLQDLIDGWSDLVSTLEDLSDTYSKPLIFTEVGTYHYNPIELDVITKTENWM